MSSRTAAARKRLVPGTSPSPSPSKGIFSRSKPTSLLSSPFYISDSHVPPSDTFSKGSNSVRANNSPSDHYHSNPYAHADTTSNVDRPRTPPFGHTSPTETVSYLSPYPSPPHDLEELPLQTIRISTRGSGGDHGAGSGYIEASYQPPPPIQASYQLPPPSHFTDANGYHGATDFAKAYRSGLQAVDSLSVSQTPLGYPARIRSGASANIKSSLPSPLSSPAQSSLSLRRSSPTPTELPTYSSVHEVAPSRTDQSLFDAQPPFHNLATGSRARAESLSYRDAPLYVPSHPQPRRLTPSPLHIPDIPSSRSSTSLPGEHDFRQPWHREARRNAVANDYSPGSANFERSSSPVVYRPTRPPESISGSSDSSGHKSADASSASSAKVKPAFVFPGSRSVARPKVSKKTGSPAIKLKGKAKTQAQQDADASPITPPVTPVPMVVVSANHRPHASNGTSQVHTAHALHPDRHSETSSAISDGSSGRSPIVGANGTWTATTPTTPMTSGTSPVPPAKIVYPGGRSRAQPSKPPLKITRPPSSKTSKSSSSTEHGGKSKFMGLLRRKKYTTGEIPHDTHTVSQSLSSEERSIADSQPSPSSTPIQEYHDDERETKSFDQESRERAKRIELRVGTYPLDPYDTVLLDNDRHTGELLVRLNPTGSPSFHNYGNDPPTSVLDLGCGQGHWVIDAAIAWKGYGTRVTGYDMVDISKGLLPWARERGVSDSIRFVRGNFLKQRLPFSNGSFDLVRMSCLALCIPSDSWVFLLQEVCRVLMVGGRLELIDDSVLFPYGKASSVLDTSGPSETQSVPPRLDISIPSSSFTTYSIYDDRTVNPGLGLPIVSGDEDGDFFDYYHTSDDEEYFDDTATVNGRDREAAPSRNRMSSGIRSRTASPALSAGLWDRAHATSGDLEALFDHMLTHKFGIRKDVHEFILDLLKDVFGHAREVRTMHLALAPPEAGLQGDSNYPSSPRESMGLSKAPGLILWPSTFIPMDRLEIEIHASKHLRLLLSCKDFLMEHAVEATDDSEIDEASVQEAIWEYEGFLRHRFHPPSPQTLTNDQDDSDFDTVSIRESIAESVCSDNREAMWELQSAFQQRLAWRSSMLSESSGSRSPTPTADAPMPTTSNAVQPFTTSPPSSIFRSGLNAIPPYSRDELTHVRTFRIYEAIKVDEALFGSAL